MDGLARRGTRFSRCLAQANATHPSFTTLFTGCDPLRHGVVGHFGTRLPDPRLPMLAERFAEGGFATAAVDSLGRWFERGFAQVDRFDYDQGAKGPLHTGEEVTDLAVGQLRGLARDRFLLFLHYWDPHTPYLPPPPYNRQFVQLDENGMPPIGDLSAVDRFAPLAPYLRSWMGDAPSLDYVEAQYDGEIAYLDGQLGRLFRELDQLGLRNSTLVVLTGDHGESMTEHGICFDHHGLYEPQVIVPLLIALPDRVRAGRVVTTPVRHVDVLPTLCSLAGLEPPEVSNGWSLHGALAGDRLRRVEPVFSCEASWQLKRAVRTDRWTLIQALEPDRYGNPLVELYDRSVDPGEASNCASDHPAEEQLLSQLLQSWVRQRERETGESDILSAQGVTLKGLRHTGDDTAEQLRARAQASLRAGSDADEGFDEEALIEERLRNLGYL